MSDNRNYNDRQTDTIVALRDENAMLRAEANAEIDRFRAELARQIERAEIAEVENVRLEKVLGTAVRQIVALRDVVNMVRENVSGPVCGGVL